MGWDGTGGAPTKTPTLYVHILVLESVFPWLIGLLPIQDVLGSDAPTPASWCCPLHTLGHVMHGFACNNGQA